ncbi:MAG TPA: TonB-dependent receptor [Thermoanaerobaculia bacterium]|nr:TonB-dependent receptor [Thermoanaerobaculia bacterium]
MRPKRFLFTVTLLALLVVPAAAHAQATGTLTGVVSGPDDRPMNGVTVVIAEAGMAEITDAAGRYRLSGVPAGDYTVTFSLGDRLSSAENVTIRGGAVTELDHGVDWEVSFAETITVYSASRRRERVVEAPAAVSVVSEEEIEREASHGQLAKVLEFTPGAEVTQSGLYDFNLNTRGFNSSLNRRVPALIDGRDPTVPFLMSNDWPSMSSLGDMASVELIRGPSSALYGTNAFNGVLNLTTKQPRYSQGGTVGLTGGELSTLRGDVRWAGQVADETYLKLVGSYTQSDDFYVSRNTSVEYGACPPGSRAFGCLPFEAVPVATDEDILWLAGVRLDRYFGNSFLTAEGGSSYAEGPVIQTGIGRVQILEQDRPWARLNFSHPRFNVLGYYNKRDAPEQLALGAGRNLVLDEEMWAAEVQGNWDFAGTRGRIIAGASYRDEEIDTRNAQGVPTLTGPLIVGADRQAVYTQLEYAFSPKVKAVLAGRWDDSSLHDDQISPKVALVFAPTPNQTLRASYNEAFQSPNYSEFFLSTPAGQPVPFVAIASQLAPPLVPALTVLGFQSVPILAFGNNNLEVEEISSWELGYSGILGGKTFLTFDYYNSELDGFVTDLLPGVNPAFPFYQFTVPLPPQAQAGVLAFLRAALGPNFVGLTNLANGAPALVFSYANAGSADTQGIDFGVTHYLDNRWNLGVSYSWFDFELKEAALGDRVLPNAPEHQAAFTLGYLGDRFDASLGARWVDDFEWAAGVFAGPVPSYETVDLVANYRVTPNVKVGVNVSNLFDDEHYQSFGGDILGRRALGSVTFTW